MLKETFFRLSSMLHVAQYDTKHMARMAQDRIKRLAFVNTELIIRFKKTSDFLDFPSVCMTLLTKFLEINNL